MKQKQLHKRNRFNSGYNFEELIKCNFDLKQYVVLNQYNNYSIDFSNPKAVKELNRALLFSYKKISKWDFPDKNLCPPIPGRLDYIHHVADLINSEKNIKILDIGTGATCVYPLLGVVEFGWNFVATDVDSDSLAIAKKNISNNFFTDKIKLRKQINKQHILKGVIDENDSFFATMCNPPFFKSSREALKENNTKNKNLGISNGRNFSGTNTELIYLGGEKAFLHNYLYESSMFPKSSKWFTSLVSKKENIKSLKKSSEKLNVKEFKIIPLNQGNKITRIICWKF